MAQSDARGLTEKDQNELLRLLESERRNTLMLIHSVPRPPRPGQAPPLMTPDGKYYVLRIPIARKSFPSSANVSQKHVSGPHW